MSNAIINQIEAGQLKADLPEVVVGDTVDVHVRIIEGDKERVQVFTGVVIARAGSGLTETITVRRIVANQGVERVFPLHSPRVAKIEIVRHGKARRSKLYFLRDRVGKARRLPDRTRGLKHAAKTKDILKREAEIARAEAGDAETEAVQEAPEASEE